MRKETYYQSSGKFSPLAFLYLLLVCLIFIPILSLAYAYAIWYIPFIYISFLLTGGFGLITAKLVEFFIIDKGKVRNVVLAILFGLTAGLFATYLQWVVWVDLALNISDTIGDENLGVAVSNIKFLEVFQLAVQPTLLFSLIKEINEYGTWGISGSSISGLFLAVIWAIEFVLIVGISVYFSFQKAKDPFCEINEEWFEGFSISPFNFITDKATLRSSLEMEKPDALDQLSLSSPTNSHSVFTIYESKQDCIYLTITNRKVKSNKKDEIEYEEDSFIKNVHISKDLRDKLHGFLSNES